MQHGTLRQLVTILTKWTTNCKMYISFVVSVRPWQLTNSWKPLHEIWKWVLLQIHIPISVESKDRLTVLQMIKLKGRAYSHTCLQALLHVCRVCSLWRHRCPHLRYSHASDAGIIADRQFKYQDREGIEWRVVIPSSKNADQLVHTTKLITGHRTCRKWEI